MNEDRIKTRICANSKFLTAVAISALFLGSGNAMAAQTNTDSLFRSDRTTCKSKLSVDLVVDASGEPVIGASVVENRNDQRYVSPIWTASLH